MLPRQGREAPVTGHGKKRRCEQAHDQSSTLHDMRAYPTLHRRNSDLQQNIVLEQSSSQPDNFWRTEEAFSLIPAYSLSPAEFPNTMALDPRFCRTNLLPSLPATSSHHPSVDSHFSHPSWESRNYLTAVDLLVRLQQQRIMDSRRADMNGIGPLTTADNATMMYPNQITYAATGRLDLPIVGESVTNPAGASLTPELVNSMLGPSFRWTGMLSSMPPTASLYPITDSHLFNSNFASQNYLTDLVQLEHQRLIMDLRLVQSNGISPLEAGIFLGIDTPTTTTTTTTTEYPDQSHFDCHIDGPLTRFGVQSIFTEGQTSHASEMSDNVASSTNNSSKRVPKSTTASLPTTPEQHGKLQHAGESSLLYTVNDRNHLNENQVFLRQQLEAFQATSDDLCSRVHGKTKTIKLHRVGIRCRHCSQLPLEKRNKASTYFPSNLMAIYQAAQNISVEHLQSGQCPALPLDTKERFSQFTPRKLLSSCGGKKYWADAARKLGLVDTDDGIRFVEDLSSAESCRGKPTGRANQSC